MRRVVRSPLTEVQAVEFACLKGVNGGSLKLAKRQPDLKPAFARHVATVEVQLYRNCKIMLFIFQLKEWQIGSGKWLRRVAPYIKRIAAEIRQPITHANRSQFRLPTSSRHRPPLQAKGIRGGEEILLLDGKRTRQ